MNCFVKPWPCMFREDLTRFQCWVGGAMRASSSPPAGRLRLGNLSHFLVVSLARLQGHVHEATCTSFA
jgi:hypothetical protein